MRAARTRDGLDVTIRAIVIGKEGYDHLKILRAVATGENSLLSNHTLFMFMEFQFEDIIFPKVGAEMLDAFGYWPNDSVGDVNDMLLQMLEVCYIVSFSIFIHSFLLMAVEFIHDLNIAHV